MSDAKHALEFLKSDLESDEKRVVLSYDEFLGTVIENPQRTIRNTFQLFHDMVKSYIGEGEDENPEDPENIGFVKYDCSRILRGWRMRVCFCSRRKPSWDKLTV